ncbi:MAG: DUF177 domain-containing protein [Armatimonadota bacterium]|nr:DUF177 domain-containing protein [Armatimonadota bacterium]MDR7518653.1 DUF177 domain-containing protein [Armatimonadota bacterium]MDR7549844.1 DUF177 domain-containing protein [Armatimonadota bacterium]
MKVDLRPLRAERGATLDVSCGDVIASGIAEIPFDRPVEGTLTLTNLGSVLRVEGRLATEVTLTCDRCAAAYRHRLEADVLEEVNWSLGVTAREAVLAEEYLIWAGDGLVLDVSALARDALVLALPMVARCRSDCPGLCDQCGADLRLGPCEHSRGPGAEHAADRPGLDPRLRPLAGWRDRQMRSGPA